MRCTSTVTVEQTPCVSAVNPELKRAKNPLSDFFLVSSESLRMEAQSAGVSVRAMITESTMAETIVTEN